MSGEIISETSECIFKNHSTSMTECTKRDKNQKNLTIVSIKTSKKLDTTDILVDSQKGREHYQAKLSELIQYVYTGDNESEQTKSVLKHCSSQPPKDNLPSDISKEEYVKTAPFIDLTHLDRGILKTTEEKSAKVLLDAGITIIHMFKRNESYLYVCPFNSCTDLFDDICVLKHHLLREANIRPYKCDYNGCKWSFTSQSRLENHKSTHSKKKDFVCTASDCNKRFSTQFNMRQHQKLTHEKKSLFVCTVSDCFAAFHTQRLLDLHMVIHEGVTSNYKCKYEECGKTFITRNALCSHMRSHEHKLEDLICHWEGCNKLFEVPCRLREHMRTHTGEKPFVCTYEGCSWSFMTSSKLKRHSMTHTQERNFHCSVKGCSKVFLRSQHLKEHELTHLKEKSYICPYENCNAQFAARSTVYCHVKKVHNKKESTADSNMNKVDSNKFSSSFENSVVTLLTGDEDGTSYLLTDFNLPEIYQVAGVDQNITITQPQPVKKPKTKVDQKKGSARTSFTYSDVIGEKHYRRQFIKKDSVEKKLPDASDTILNGDQHNLMDELYPQEELPILLLESNNSRHSEFEASTINLRDLE